MPDRVTIPGLFLLCLALIGLLVTVTITAPGSSSAARPPDESPPGESEPTGTSVPGAEPLIVVAADTAFDQDELTAAPGTIHVTFRNEDALPHNIHFFEGEDASGTSVGATEIEDGPDAEQQLSFDTEPGTYYYQCDVHPTEMTGTLTVASA